jgi:hypothetical protein
MNSISNEMFSKLITLSVDWNACNWGTRLVAFWEPAAFAFTIAIKCIFLDFLRVKPIFNRLLHNLEYEPSVINEWFWDYVTNSINDKQVVLAVATQIIAIIILIGPIFALCAVLINSTTREDGLSAPHVTSHDTDSKIMLNPTQSPAPVRQHGNTFSPQKSITIKNPFLSLQSTFGRNLHGDEYFQALRKENVVGLAKPSEEVRVQLADLFETVNVQEVGSKCKSDGSAPKEEEEVVSASGNTTEAVNEIIETISVCDSVMTHAEGQRCIAKKLLCDDENEGVAGDGYLGPEEERERERERQEEITVIYTHSTECLSSPSSWDVSATRCGAATATVTTMNCVSLHLQQEQKQEQKQEQEQVEDEKDEDESAIVAVDNALLQEQEQEQEHEEELAFRVELKKKAYLKASAIEEEEEKKEKQRLANKEHERMVVGSAPSDYDKDDEDDENVDKTVMLFTRSSSTSTVLSISSSSCSCSSSSSEDLGLHEDAVPCAGTVTGAGAGAGAGVHIDLAETEEEEEDVDCRDTNNKLSTGVISEGAADTGVCWNLVQNMVQQKNEQQEQQLDNVDIFEEAEEGEASNTQKDKAEEKGKNEIKVEGTIPAEDNHSVACTSAGDATGATFEINDISQTPLLAGSNEKCL